MTYLKTSDDVKIYYQFHNNKSKKPPIVFVHGFAVNWTCFKKEIEFFKKEGYPVLYFDLRGHGKSGRSKEQKGYSFQRFGKDIEELIKINKISKKIILVGHSLGGMISIHFAVKKQNKISKLIIVDSADKAPNKHELLEKIQKNIAVKKTFEFLSHHINNKNTTKELDVSKIETQSNPITFFVEQILSSNIMSLLKITNTIFKKSLIKNNQIKIPTLIIGSNNDELFSKKEELELKKKIKYSIIKIFPGKHDLIIRNPNLVSQEIKQFIHTDKDFFKKF